MRGKKDYFDEWLKANNFANENELLAYLVSEEVNPNADEDRLQQLENLYYNRELIPRNFYETLKQGYMGMRGKKFYSDDSSDDYNDGNDENENDFNNDNYIGDDKIYKRDPNAGFFGMRGKKAFYDDSGVLFHDDKRVPMGFNGEI